MQKRRRVGQPFWGAAVSMLLAVWFNALAFAQPKDILFTNTASILMQVNPDGTGLTSLGLNGIAPRWSPNGAKLAFLRPVSTQYELVVADADGSNSRTLSTNVGWETYQWSPDSTRIAFLGNGDFESGFELVVVNVNDGSLQSLGVRVGPASGAVSPFVWTPDGSQILFVAPSGQLRYVRLSDRTVTPLSLQGFELAFHPSGTFFVYKALVSTQFELFVANADGTNARPLNLTGSHPILSPNGQFLLFTSEPFSSPAFVQQLDSSGNRVGAPVLLNVTAIPEGLFASWSPDSSKVVLSVESGDAVALVVVNRDGTGRTPLNVEGFEPQWRPRPLPPQLLEPADNALVSPTPTFRIRGTMPSGAPNRLVYFLDLSQDNFVTVRTIEPGTTNGWDRADYGPNDIATLTLSSPLAEGRWQWRVRAAFATQPTVQSDLTAPRTFSILDNRNRIPAGVSFVGLPFIPTNSTREGLGLTSDTRVAVYDPSVSPTPYRYDAAAEPLPIGKAFWVRSTTAQSPQVSGTLFSFPIVVNLAQGWNAVGNPLPSPLAWNFTAPTAVRIRQGSREFTLEDAIRRGLISPFVWVWNETANRYDLVYDPSVLPAQSGDPFRNDIPAWRGFWLYANAADLRLVIDQTPRLAPLANRQARKVTSTDGVVLTLSVRKGGQVIGTALAGVRSDVPTRLMAPPPPAAPDGGGTALVLDGGNSADIRSGQRRQVWTVQVNEGEELTWSGLIPRGWRATLVDPATNTQRTLRSSKRLPVQAGQRLLLIVEPDTGQPLRVVNLQAQPLRGRGVQISFALTAPAQATVTIMTLTGRPIAVLGGSTRSAGAHHFFWRGVSEDGRPAPAGAYLIRVQVSDETGRTAQAMRTVMWR